MNILMLGLEESWFSDGIGHRPVMLARALSRLPEIGKVLVVNNPISIGGRLRKWLVQRPSACVGSQKLEVLNLTSFWPEPWKIWNAGERIRLSRWIDAIVRQKGLGRPVLWLQTPRAADLAENIGRRKFVFDAMDDMREDPRYRGSARIAEGYQWVERHADRIFIATCNQRSMFSTQEKLAILPNAVDDIFFDEGIPPRPTDLPSGRIAGYVGMIQDRLDAELVREAASALPDIAFVFVGAILNREAIRPLAGLRNVHFLGIRPYSTVPAYIRHFDICLLPHRINAFTQSMNPLKIYEYLASGKPVVSTPVAGTEVFAEQLELAQGPADFISALRRALSESGPEKAQARRRAVSDCRWDVRAREILKWIQ